MPRLAVLVALACFSPLQCWAGEKPIEPRTDVARRVDQDVGQILTDLQVPGASIALIEGGEIVLLKGYGYADRERRIPVSPDTLFLTGSTSKAVAAWGAMKLVERGQLRLDEPVVDRLRRWQLPDSPFNEKGVTVRRLLSHTAGLSLSGYRGWGPMDQKVTLEESLSGKTNGAGGVALIAEPGTRWEYSGGGYTYLQLLVEETARRPFAQYMAETVLKPLCMQSSTFDFATAVLGPVATAYDELSEPTATPVFTETAAAGMYTTAGDLARFGQAVMDRPRCRPGCGVLKPSTIDIMTSPAPATDEQWGVGYKLLIGDNGFPDRVDRVGHDGGSKGWHTLFWVSRGAKDGIIVLTNASHGWNVSNQLLQRWINAKSGKGRPIRRSVGSSILEAYHHGGSAAALARYDELKSMRRDDFVFGEEELNQLGYAMLQKGRYKDAIAFFEKNASEYPESGNLQDSLGDAFYAAGDSTRAIAAYRRAVTLDPANEHAASRVKELVARQDRQGSP